MSTDSSRVCTGAVVVVGCAIALKAALAIKASLRHRRFRAEVAAQSKNVVHLFTMTRTDSVLHLSAPCMKSEAALRIGRVPYVIHLDMANTSLSPSGCVPFAAINGELITDSDTILKKVVELRLGHAAGLDGSLTKEQAAMGQALKRMIEGDFNRGIYRTAFVDNIDAIAKSLIVKHFGVPLFLAKLLGRHMRKGIIHKLNASGFGDLTDTQYVEATLDDAKAIEAMIEKHCYFGPTGTKKYILGTPQPTSYDVAVFSRLYGAIWKVDVVPQGQSAIFDYIRASKPINGYVEAIKALAFPDEAEVLAGHKASEQRFVNRD